MNDQQLPQNDHDLIVETHRDVQWLKEWSRNHTTEHSRYIYYFIVTAMAVEDTKSTVAEEAMV